MGAAPCRALGDDPSAELLDFCVEILRGVDAVQRRYEPAVRYVDMDDWVEWITLRDEYQRKISVKRWLLSDAFGLHVQSICLNGSGSCEGWIDLEGETKVPSRRTRTVQEEDGGRQFVCLDGGVQSRRTEDEGLLVFSRQDLLMPSLSRY